MALAEERLQIGIRRHFTAEGRHPYEQVRWERRDSRISDYRTGEVAFEQLDVEVPSTWSMNATNILAQKYFRGTLGTPEREWSLRQVVDRVVDTVTAWGVRDGYFSDAEEAEAFSDELKHLIVEQKAAFNSPVWFNIGVKGVPQQASACFILAVEDSMSSILNWYVEEGTIFKGGSGSGVNLSRIRSSRELLQGGGTASGPVSFMRGADASAGTIKSGGKTRRAAKMVILDADHPDIREFIWCKAREERKARVLAQAGFDMDLDGADSHSTQYQNANNSVRLSDEFMRAVLEDSDWDLVARTTGQPVETLKARDLFRQIAEAAWECADPGLQYDTTINKWHTAPETGRINGSNPCFTADMRVHTNRGVIRFDQLIARVSSGEQFSVYTHDATRAGEPAEVAVLSSPEAFMITGFNDIVRLRFENGMELRCTSGHRVFTTNRGFVPAADLAATDRVKVLDVPAPAVEADLGIPVATDPTSYREPFGRSELLRLPEEWSEDFAHYLGWLFAAGSTSGSTTSTIYGSAEDRDEVLPRHARLVEWVNADRPVKVFEQADGTAQLRLGWAPFKRFLESLGITSVKEGERPVPWAIEQAPMFAAGAFLQGLFDADGCVRLERATGSQVGLTSISSELLRGVQRLLTTFGISADIYETGRGSAVSSFARTDVRSSRDESAPLHELRIAPSSLRRFAAEIGFSLSAKAALLAEVVGPSKGDPDNLDRTTTLAERVADGRELTYNLSEPRNHSYIVNGVVVRNCSEYMHLDNSSCNLASLNLLRFLDDSDVFDVEGFRAAVAVVFTAQEILVGNADYPTEKIAETTRAFRELGLGYANLGALLMAQGVPYDSDQGRAWAAAITALMTGSAYETSARTAARMGPFAGYHANSDAMLNVLRMHHSEVSRIDESLVPVELLSAAQKCWDEAVEQAGRYGVRNAQASVLAPTGCLVGGTLVPTNRGLVRLGSLGDPGGRQWQGLSAKVATDEGTREATRFYVNGLSPVADLRTRRGYRLRGTPQHRVKVVEPASGSWVWRHLSDLREGDLVPLSLSGLVGPPQHVPLPSAPDPDSASQHELTVPRAMTPKLAELVGYFMGDGSLRAEGICFCVNPGDLDVVSRLEVLCKEVFGLTPHTSDQRGYTEVRLDSERLVLWWKGCGFAKTSATSGKARESHVPDAVLHSNDREVYGSFIRGLYEAGGDTSAGYPTLRSTSLQMVEDVQAILLTLGFPTTLSYGERRGSPGESKVARLRLVNLSYCTAWSGEIGFIGVRKSAGVRASSVSDGARSDGVPVTRSLIDRLAPGDDRLRKVMLLEHSRTATVSRRAATELWTRSRDAELGRLLGFFYDPVVSSVLEGEELTYDLSVPENVTYVANGFVSHNTISFLMDCDTTGIEPDLGLVKTKKLVGGGTMSIVNQTVPRALRRLGYSDAQVEAMIAYIDEHKSIVGAPGLVSEHLPVFACSMGDNVIHYLGHVRMMAAAQPFISGAISKSVNMPEEATVEEIEQLHVDAWQMGLKSIAIYRDNCKVAQPLATTKKEVVAVLPPEEAGVLLEIGQAAFTAREAELTARIAELEGALQHSHVTAPSTTTRTRLPRRRRSNTFAFRVADCEGYVTVGEYEDGRPGEVFMKVSKQGSTLSGVMDAFSIAVSLGLQHGVPISTFVRKYTNMRFEPAGITDDAELRLASSLVDYIFRRLALDYLSFDERLELGVLSTNERSQPTLPGLEDVESGEAAHREQERFGAGGDTDRPVPGIERAGQAPAPTGLEGPSGRVARPTGSARPMESRDAPFCYACGNIMQRAGSCYACPSCGATSGCS